MRRRFDRCQPACYRLYSAGPGDEQEIYHLEHSRQRRWGYLARETLANAQRQVVIKEMLDYYDPADPIAQPGLTNVLRPKPAPW